MELIHNIVFLQLIENLLAFNLIVKVVLFFYYLLFIICTKGPSTIKFITALTEFSRNINADLKHLKKINMKLTIITFLLQLLQTFLKHLIVSIMNFSLLD